MKKYSKINENDVRRLIKQILTEGISNDVIDTIYNSHPGNISPDKLYPLIIPKQYKSTEPTNGKPRTWWLNTCATKMSLALIKSGYNVRGNYKTEVEYNGVPANSYFNPSSLAMIGILGGIFGTNEIDGYQKIPLISGEGRPIEIRNKKGVYVITTNVWGDAAGHTDVWNGSISKGGDHWGVPGTLHFWGAPTKLEINTKNCGWGNDEEGYKNSNFKCYKNSLDSTPAKNAKKCGYGSDVKSYRESGWECKTSY